MEVEAEVCLSSFGYGGSHICQGPSFLVRLVSSSTGTATLFSTIF